MKPNYMSHAVFVFALLGAAIACVLPGQATQPAPPLNPITIETAVAGTAQAAALQTQQANPATAIVAPTDIPATTPKVSLVGTSLIVQADQSTIFIDHTAGTQLIIPAGWMAVRANEEEYYKAFSLPVVLENPVINDRLTQIQDVEPGYQRLDAIDIRPGHVPNGIISNITVIYDSQKAWSLEKWEQEERNRKRPFDNYKFISSGYSTTSNGMQILISEQSWDAAQDKGTVYYRAAFFSLSSGTFVLIIYTDNDFKDVVLPDFEQVVNSVTPLNP